MATSTLILVQVTGTNPPVVISGYTEAADAIDAGDAAILADPTTWASYTVIPGPDTPPGPINVTPSRPGGGGGNAQ